MADVPFMDEERGAEEARQRAFWALASGKQPQPLVADQEVTPQQVADRRFAESPFGWIDKKLKGAEDWVKGRVAKRQEPFKEMIAKGEPGAAHLGLPDPVELGAMMGVGGLRTANRWLYGTKDPSQLRDEDLLGPLGMSAMGAPFAAMKHGVALGSAGGKLAGKEMLDMSTEARMARAKEMGFDTDTTWYHGANRADRLVEKGKIDPKRSTSGPMPFFTDDPGIASNYAKGKSDTSMMDDGDVSKYFTVSPKDLGDTRGRTPYTVEQSWYRLPPEKRAEIMENMKRVGYRDVDEATGPFTLHPEGTDASLNGSHLDYLTQESRGNPLAGLRKMWLEGGDLHGNEDQLAQIWKLAGYPHPISQTNAPWTEAPGVLPAHLRMQRPLDTANADEIKTKIIPALREAFKGDRTRLKEHGADDWDKTTRWTPKQWVDQLEQDLIDGKNGMVWTSIPDKVTKALRDLGYDGIVDSGGKMGGDGHRVAIPFAPEQVRSPFAAFDPAKADSGNLLAANPGTEQILELMRAQQQLQSPFTQDE